MDWKEIITYIIYLVITGVLLPLISVGIAKLNAWLKTKITNEKFNNSIDITTKLVEDSVAMVLQTYVDTLKKQGNFNAKAQKIAFDLAFNNAKKLITADMQKVIETVYGDFDKWLTTEIEAKVGTLKK